MKKSRLVVFVFCIIVALVTRSLGQSTGNVSFYANSLHGKKTSDGSTYHRDSMTCAHRYFPFGTLLRITNPKNSRHVKVRVTDRGPFVRKLTFDLSHAAARHLDFLKDGFAAIEFDIISPIIPPYRAYVRINWIYDEIDDELETVSQILSPKA